MSVGILGGIISALTGSGLDILTFSLLTLYFNICEKIATPTSVILMAINSVCAILMKQHYFNGVHPQAFEYLLVCIPVVIIGAPLGSLIIKNKRRKFVTGFLLTTISIQFLTAVVIIPLTIKIVLLGLITLISGLTLFGLMSLNSKQIEQITENEKVISNPKFNIFNN